MILKPKLSLEEFIKNCTPLYKIPALEADFAERVRHIARALLEFQPSGDPVQTLISFLRADDDFLGIVLALTNLSQEKFLRILTAERFAQQDYRPEWKADRVLREVRNNDHYAERIARLFLEGRNSSVLVQQIADFYLAQLELPGDWQKRIRDETLVDNLIRRKLMGEYADAKGKAIERLIHSYLARLHTDYGIAFEHGQVPLVQKEVDFALPDLIDPFVMIMVSYMETTSSGQTARANEQLAMYQKVMGENIRYGNKRVLVNILDGSGWLARRSDLRKMHAGCDYALTLTMLDQLDAIICHHVPVKFFTVAPRPRIEVGQN